MLRATPSCPRSARVLPAMVAAALLLASCGRSEKAPTAPGPEPRPIVADFSLVDVNPNSATSGQAVSPRQKLARVSAWYFGHAT